MNALVFLLRSFGIYLLAGFAEIAGCFAVWLWIKEGRSGWLTVPGLISLCIFAFLLTRIDEESASRAYAAYGGVYITASLIWMRCVEGRTPDKWEMTGALICLLSAGVILFAPRHG